MLNVDLATEEDGHAILALQNAGEAWLAERGIRQWDRREMSLPTVLEHIRRREYYVGREEPGEAVRAAFRLLWSDEAVWGHQAEFSGYVRGLVIDRSCAGRGLGSQLLDWAAERARNAGAALLRLDCGQDNAALRDYYARAGFVEVGRRDCDPHCGYGAVLLERRITNAH
ncbi:hypothetical protein BFN03_14830 [Rhodococcus sp. WMMA185]|nr:hypothetical protein BFN03_14830 [Rhodococcus sp. WMMA185]